MSTRPLEKMRKLQIIFFTHLNIKKKEMKSTEFRKELKHDGVAIL